MNDTANPTGAEIIEVTDVESAAQALMAREESREIEPEVEEAEETDNIPEMLKRQSGL